MINVPRKGSGMPFEGLEEIFSSVQKEAAGQTERVQQIPLSELHPFEGHPFRVVDDEEMQKTVESVKEYGVLTPAIARPDPDGGYEIISGHRRMRAAELAGLKTLPVIVRDMDDDNLILSYLMGHEPVQMMWRMIGTGAGLCLLPIIGEWIAVQVACLNLLVKTWLFS